MKWYYGLLILLSILLFVGGPDVNSHRVVQQVWNSGHIVLFAGFVWLLLHLPVLEKRQWYECLLITTVFCLTLGLIIEFLQLLVGRSFEMKDLLNDLLGGYLGFLVFTVRQFWRHQMIRGLMFLLMSGIVTWGVWPVAVNALDELKMNDDFPVLADFETPFELSRWKSNFSDLSIVTDHVRDGLKSMRVDIGLGQYPGVSLAYFVSDWQGFKWLKFSIFNASAESHSIELKIFDEEHKLRGLKYKDRYNRKLVLKPGMNDLLISVDEVKLAPAEREMNLGDIAGVSLFLHDPQQPVTLYVDSLRLLRRD